MNEHISLRPAETTDTEFARQVHHEAFKAVVEKQFGEWDEALQNKLFIESWDRPGYQIVQFDGEPCGYYLAEELPDEIMAGELALLPGSQGRGIGTTLLESLQQRASERHVPVRLQVLKENEAKALYERLGFTTYDETDTHFLMEWLPE